MTTFLRMSEQDLQEKSVLIREDLNVPVRNGKITNDARLQAALPTIKLALEKGAGVIIMSHLGRPTEGEYDDSLSLAPVAAYLSAALGQEVQLVQDMAAAKVKAGEVLLLENVRFNVGEKKNSEALAKQYASLCDVFVMDAFGTAHRAQASTEGVSRHAALACAGPLLANELDALGKAMQSPQKPMLAIVGGSKVSTKLDVLTSLADVCDSIIVGGGIANTFIAAAGHNVGKSLYEADLIDTAKRIAQQVNIPLPTDVVVINASDIGDDFMASVAAATATVKKVTEVADNDMILDIGPETAAAFASQLHTAKTILWNGPVGVFEVDAFGEGTKAISHAIAQSEGFSIAGGGDTLAAIDKYAVKSGISYVSTGGGAFLEFVEGKTLPAVAALVQN